MSHAGYASGMPIARPNPRAYFKSTQQTAKRTSLLHESGWAPLSRCALTACDACGYVWLCSLARKDATTRCAAIVVYVWRCHIFPIIHANTCILSFNTFNNACTYPNVSTFCCQHKSERLCAHYRVFTFQSLLWTQSRSNESRQISTAQWKYVRQFTITLRKTPPTARRSLPATRGKKITQTQNPALD